MKMYVYTEEYHSAVKKNENIKDSGKWTEPGKKIIMSEVTDSKRQFYVSFSMYSYSIRIKLYEITPTFKFPIL